MKMNKTRVTGWNDGLTQTVFSGGSMRSTGPDEDIREVALEMLYACRGDREYAYVSAYNTARRNGTKYYDLTVTGP